MIFNYDELTWPNRKIEKAIESGYYFAALNQFMQINEITLGNLNKFASGSNCNVKGKYIYRVNHSSIYLFRPPQITLETFLIVLNLLFKSIGNYN